MDQDNNCAICNTVLDSINKLDIQLSTTLHGNVNVEWFIKHEVLSFDINIELKSKYICEVCFESINQFEDYFLKSKQIQQLLAEKYLNNNGGMKVEQLDCSTLIIPAVDILTEDDNSKTEEIITLDFKTETKRKSRRNVKQKFAFTDSEDNDNDETVKRKPKVRTRRKKDVNETLESKNPEDSSKEEETCEENTKKNSKKAKKVSNEKKYCCEICGKITDKGNAAKHMNSHTHKKLFTCEYCNWQFTQNGDLQRHLRLHKGIFPYQCEYCPKRFAHHTSFDIHLKNHLGKRDHICVVCGRGLLSQSHLVRHMKTHTGEKEFACEICGKTCAEKSNLKKHMQIHLKQQSVESSNNV